MKIVELDRPRSFKFGMRGIDFIEKSLGCPIGKVDFSNMTMEQTIVVIQGGLVHEDKEIGLKTPEELMDIIDSKGNLGEVLEAIGEAMKGMGGRNKKQTKN